VVSGQNPARGSHPVLQRAEGPAASGRWSRGSQSRSCSVSWRQVFLCALTLGGAGGFILSPCVCSDRPDAPAEVRMVEHDANSLVLEWDEPFSDGVWIDSHEVQVVALEDTWLPGSLVDGSANATRCPDACVAVQDDDETDFLEGSIDGPWILRGGHLSGHRIAGLPPWSAFRCRIRVNTMVGWSAWSPSFVVHTAGMYVCSASRLRGCLCQFLFFKISRAFVAGSVPYCPQDVCIPGHEQCHVRVRWSAPRPNGAPITHYCFQIRTVPAWVDEFGVIHRGDDATRAGLEDTSMMSSQYLDGLVHGEFVADMSMTVPSLETLSEFSLENTVSQERPTRTRLQGTTKSSHHFRKPKVVTDTPPVLPDLARPCSELLPQYIREPAKDVELSTLDKHHPLMWRHFEWLKRPDPDLERPSRRSQTAWPSPLSHQSNRMLKSSQDSGSSPLVASGSITSLDSLMPFLPAASALSVPISGRLLTHSEPPTPIVGSPSRGSRFGTPRHLQFEDASPTSIGSHPALTGLPTLVKSSRHPSFVIRRDTIDRIGSKLGVELRNEVEFETSGVVEPSHTIEESIERPDADDDWYNTGELIPAASLAGFVYDVASERDVFVRVFARNAFGWSAPGTVSTPYWMPDCPALLKATSRSLRITLGSRGQPPFQLQVQVCAADVWNGAPLDWTPAKP
jgi:hypothetical protein